MKKEDKYIARELFKAKVLQLEGQAFEDFFVLIMKRVNPQFQSVRAYGNIGDQKNDGFDSTTGTYYQVFAPDNIAKKQTIQEAVKKLENDFSKLYEYWNNYSEIKKFYEKQGLVYEYSQFALTVNNEAAIRMCEHLEKPNPRKYFKRKGIKYSFGYIDSEREVRIIKTNYAMG